jgi:phosphoribosylformylglycinamidine synthase subunit PurL
VGELPDPQTVPAAGFSAGDAIALVGPFSPSLAGSELAKLRGELDLGLPMTEIVSIAAAHAGVRKAARSGALRSAHDVSDGGIACAIAECAIAGGTGAEVDLGPLLDRGASAEEALFGEGPGGFIVSGARAALEGIEADVLIVGEAGGDRIELSTGDAGHTQIKLDLRDAERAWRSLAERL